MTNHVASCALVALLAAAGSGCSDDPIDSDEEARRAYLGLDGSIEKSLNLGFDGFNAASSANIDPQATVGDAAGALVVTGQVDQGSSANKEMRLRVGMTDYSDGIFVVVIEDGEDDLELEVDLSYDTAATVEDQPYLHLSLRDVPDGTFTGELTGVYLLDGDIEGEVELDLAMTGEIEDGGGGLVVRVPGTTTVTGTATSGDGLYAVDVTL
jgi:hypothetical protein